MLSLLWIRGNTPFQMVRLEANGEIDFQILENILIGLDYDIKVQNLTMHKIGKQRLCWLRYQIKWAFTTGWYFVFMVQQSRFDHRKIYRICHNISWIYPWHPVAVTIRITTSFKRNHFYFPLLASAGLDSLMATNSEKKQCHNSRGNPLQGRLPVCPTSSFVDVSYVAAFPIAAFPRFRHWQNHRIAGQFRHSDITLAMREPRPSIVPIRLHRSQDGYCSQNGTPSKYHQK